MTVYGEWLRKFIVWGLAAYIFLVSVMFTIATENTVLIKATFGQTLIFALTFLWFARLLEEGKFKFLPAEFNGPLLWLLLGCTLSLAISPFQYYSLMEMAHYVSYFLSVWLIYNNVRTKNEFLLLLWSFVAATVYSIGYAIIQKLGLDPIQWGMPVFISTYGNANFFSAYLMCALPPLLAMCFAFRSWVVRGFAAVVLLAGIWCLYVAETRSAWLGFFAALFVFFCLQVLWGRLAAQLHRVLLGITVAAIVLTAVFAMLQSAIYTGVLPMPTSGSKAYELMSMFKVSYGVEKGTNQVRIVMWMGAAKMWAEKPLLGQGIGTFRLMFPRFRPSYYHRWGVSHNTDYPHNEYIGVAADQGMLGLILFGWCWWAFFHATGRGIINARDPFWRHMLIGLVCAYIAHLTDNATSPHVRWPATAVAAYFVLGLGFVAVRLMQNALPQVPRALPLTRNLNPLKYVAYGLMVVVFAFSAFCEWQVYKGELLMKQGEAYLQGAGGAVNDSNRHIWQAALETFSEARRTNPFNHSVLYKLSYIHLQMGSPQQALDTYRALMAIAPHYAQIHYNVGLVYQLLGKPFESLEQFALATRIEDNPNNQTLLGSTLMNPPLHEYLRATNRFPRIADAEFFDWTWHTYNAHNFLRSRDPRHHALVQGEIDFFRYHSRNRFARSFSLTGTAFGLNGDTKRQRYYYRRTLVWHPYESEALLRQAEFARATNDFSRYAESLTAIISNTSATEIGGDNLVRNNYIMALNEIGRHVSQNQNNSQFWDLLAIGNLALGDLPKARDCARNALVINPGNTLAAERLRVIEQRLAPAPVPAAPAPAPVPGPAGSFSFVR